MKPHFTSLSHFLKFKKYYEGNHFLKNQVTADLKARELLFYKDLEEKLLKPSSSCQKRKVMNSKTNDISSWLEKSEGNP